MTAEERLVALLNPRPELGFFEKDGVRINYVVGGSGQSMVLLHGGTSGWGMWYRLLPQLYKHFRVFALDIPGSGGSSKQIYANHTQHVGVIADFMRTMCLGNSIVVGHSYGGWLALQLALRSLSSIEKIVLFNSMGFSLSAPLLFRFSTLGPVRYILTKTVLSPTRQHMDDFIRSVFSDRTLKLPTELFDYFYEALFRDSLLHPLEFIASLYQYGRLNEKFDLRDDCSKISIPILGIWGSDDPVVPPELQRKGFSLLPHADFNLCDQSGHVPPLECPEECLKLILNFCS
jgi:pimeloyl-ACP methyl ester carboxylesterase